MHFGESKFELRSLVQEIKPIKLLKSELANRGRLKNYKLGLCKNVDKRFPDIPLLQSFSIFDPSAVPHKMSPEMKTHGMEEIKTIHSHFFGDSPAILNELLAEYTLLKFHMLKCKNEIHTGDSPSEWCLLKIMTMKFEF